MSVTVLMKMKAEIKLWNEVAHVDVCIHAMLHYRLLENGKNNTTKKKKHNGDCHHNLRGGNYKNIREH